MKNFFIIGAPKTGTTLLARLIDSHPDIACTTELFPFHVVGGKRKASPNFKNKLVDHGFTDKDINYLLMSTSLHEVGSILQRKNIDNEYVKILMDAIFGDFGKRCNASIVGDKFPWYIGFIDDMLEMFPDAKYIYTVRDPRAVYNSAKHFLRAGRANQILNMMLRYDEKIEKYLSLDNEQIRLIGYEEIVKRQNFTTNFLAEVLEVENDFDLTRTPLYPERFKHMPNVMKPLDPKIIDKWTTMLSPREIKHVNKISKKFMEKYGYEN